MARKVKLPLYARHGVPEVWIVNIGDSVVEVYRDPKDNTYQTNSHATRGEMLEPAALPKKKKIRDIVAPITSAIANAYIDFSAR